MGPAGEPIDLTGQWLGGAATHYLRHYGRCVWWVGLSSLPGEEPGASWMVTFTGRLAENLTLDGEWAHIYTRWFGETERECRISMRLDFDSSSTDEGMRLVTISPSLDDPCSYFATTMTRVGDLP